MFRYIQTSVSPVHARQGPTVGAGHLEGMWDRAMSAVAMSGADDPLPSAERQGNVAVCREVSVLVSWYVPHPYITC